MSFNAPASGRATEPGAPLPAVVGGRRPLDSLGVTTGSGGNGDGDDDDDDADMLNGLDDFGDGPALASAAAALAGEAPPDARRQRAGRRGARRAGASTTTAPASDSASLCAQPAPAAASAAGLTAAAAAAAAGASAPPSAMFGPSKPSTGPIKRPSTAAANTTSSAAALTLDAHPYTAPYVAGAYDAGAGTGTGAGPYATAYSADPYAGSPYAGDPFTGASYSAVSSFAALGAPGPSPVGVGASNWQLQQQSQQHLVDSPMTPFTATIAGNSAVRLGARAASAQAQHAQPPAQPPLLAQARIRAPSGLRLDSSPDFAAAQAGASPFRTGTGSGPGAGTGAGAAARVNAEDGAGSLPSFHGPHEFHGGAAGGLTLDAASFAFASGIAAAVGSGSGSVGAPSPSPSASPSAGAGFTFSGVGTGTAAGAGAGSTKPAYYAHTARKPVPSVLSKGATSLGHDLVLSLREATERHDAAVRSRNDAWDISHPLWRWVPHYLSGTLVAYVVEAMGVTLLRRRSLLDVGVVFGACIALVAVVISLCCTASFYKDKVRCISTGVLPVAAAVGLVGALVGGSFFQSYWYFGDVAGDVDSHMHPGWYTGYAFAPHTTVSIADMQVWPLDDDNTLCLAPLVTLEDDEDTTAAVAAAAAAAAAAKQADRLGAHASPAANAAAAAVAAAAVSAASGAVLSPLLPPSPLPMPLINGAVLHSETGAGAVPLFPISPSAGPGAAAGDGGVGVVPVLKPVIPGAPLAVPALVIIPGTGDATGVVTGVSNAPATTGPKVIAVAVTDTAPGLTTAPATKKEKATSAMTRIQELKAQSQRDLDSEADQKHLHNKQLKEAAAAASQPPSPAAPQLPQQQPQQSPSPSQLSSSASAAAGVGAGGASVTGALTVDGGSAGAAGPGAGAGSGNGGGGNGGSGGPAVAVPATDVQMQTAVSTQINSASAMLPDPIGVPIVLPKPLADASESVGEVSIKDRDAPAPAPGPTSTVAPVNTPVAAAAQAQGQGAGAAASAAATQPTAAPAQPGSVVTGSAGDSGHGNLKKKKKKEKGIVVILNPQKGAAASSAASGASGGAVAGTTGAGAGAGGSGAASTGSVVTSTAGAPTAIAANETPVVMSAPGSLSRPTNAAAAATPAGDAGAFAQGPPPAPLVDSGVFHPSQPPQRGPPESVIAGFFLELAAYISSPTSLLLSRSSPPSLSVPSAPPVPSVLPAPSLTQPRYVKAVSASAASRYPVSALSTPASATATTTAVPTAPPLAPGASPALPPRLWYEPRFGPSESPYFTSSSALRRAAPAGGAPVTPYYYWAVERNCCSLDKVLTAASAPAAAAVAAPVSAVGAGAGARTLVRGASLAAGGALSPAFIELATAATASASAAPAGASSVVTVSAVPLAAAGSDAGIITVPRATCETFSQPNLYREAERYSPRGVWDDALEALAKQNPNIKIARSHAFLEMVTKGTLYGRQTDRITSAWLSVVFIPLAWPVLAGLIYVSLSCWMRCVTDAGDARRKGPAYFTQNIAA